MSHGPGRPRWRAAFEGLLAAVAGLALDWAIGAAHPSLPFAPLALADRVVRLVPGALETFAIERLQHAALPLLGVGTTVCFLVLGSALGLAFYSSRIGAAACAGIGFGAALAAAELAAPLTPALPAAVLSASAAGAAYAAVLLRPSRAAAPRRWSSSARTATPRRSPSSRRCSRACSWRSRRTAGRSPASTAFPAVSAPQPSTGSRTRSGSNGSCSPTNASRATGSNKVGPTPRWSAPSLESTPRARPPPASPRGSPASPGPGCEASMRSSCPPTEAAPGTAPKSSGRSPPTPGHAGPTAGRHRVPAATSSPAGPSTARADSKTPPAARPTPQAHPATTNARWKWLRGSHLASALSLVWGRGAARPRLRLAAAAGTGCALDRGRTGRASRERAAARRRDRHRGSAQGAFPAARPAGRGGRDRPLRFDARRCRDTWSPGRVVAAVRRREAPPLSRPAVRRRHRLLPAPPAGPRMPCADDRRDRSSPKGGRSSRHRHRRESAARCPSGTHMPAEGVRPTPARPK